MISSSKIVNGVVNQVMAAVGMPEEIAALREAVEQKSAVCNDAVAAHTHAVHAWQQAKDRADRAGSDHALVAKAQAMEAALPELYRQRMTARLDMLVAQLELSAAAAPWADQSSALINSVANELSGAIAKLRSAGAGMQSGMRTIADLKREIGSIEAYFGTEKGS